MCFVFTCASWLCVWCAEGADAAAVVLESMSRDLKPEVEHSVAAAAAAHHAKAAGAVNGKL